MAHPCTSELGHHWFICHYWNQYWRMFNWDILRNKPRWNLNHTKSAILLISQRVDISWWRHQMEAFSALPAICAENSPVPGEFPVQRPLTRSFDIFFDLRLNKRLRNNREAGDLRRYCAHHDVIEMCVFVLVDWISDSKKMSVYQCRDPTRSEEKW